MPTEPTQPNTLDIYSHDTEIRALRVTLSRLEAQLEQTTELADLVRLSAAISRVSNSIVRAVAAHHKLATLAEKCKLKEEWAKLEQARGLQEEDEAQRKRDRAVEFHNDQVHWLLEVSRVAHEVAAGDPFDAKQLATGLDAYIEAGNYTYPPDRFTLARLGYAVPAGAQGNNNPGAVVTHLSNRSERDPVVQLR